jgi:hypothetical protein
VTAKVIRLADWERAPNAELVCCDYTATRHAKTEAVLEAIAAARQPGRVWSVESAAACQRAAQRALELLQWLIDYVTSQDGRADNELYWCARVESLFRDEVRTVRDLELGANARLKESESAPGPSCEVIAPSRWRAAPPVEIPYGRGNWVCGCGRKYRNGSSFRWHTDTCTGQPAARKPKRVKSKSRETAQDLEERFG